MSFVPYLSNFLCLLLVLLTCNVDKASSHPLCLDSSYPLTQPSPNLSYCSEYQPQSCCNSVREINFVTSYVVANSALFSSGFALNDKTTWTTCDTELIKISCLHCSPYEAHLFETDPVNPLLCDSTYCSTTFQASCGVSKGITCTSTGGLVSTDPWCYPIVNAPVPTSVAGLAPVYPGIVVPAPVDIRWTSTDPAAAYIVAQMGYIYRITPDPQRPGFFVKSIFLDVSATTNFQGELGLLGFEFDPNYSVNCYIFTYGTLLSQSTNKVNVLSRFYVPNCGNNTSSPQVDVNTRCNLLTITKTTNNHNGGSIQFDSHSDLFLSVGDGGTQNDGSDNGQNTWNLFGTIIRITPARPSNPASCSSSLGSNYTIPSTNPFGSIPGAGIGGLSEIYAWGFRNPWTCNFIQPGDKLYCGDVGQQRYEEIDRIYLGGNYGWSLAEGDGPLNQATPTEYGTMYNSPNYKRPLADYRHSGQYPLHPRTVANILGFSLIYGGPYNGRFLGAKYKGNNFHIFADSTESTISGIWIDESEASSKPPSGEVLNVASPFISRVRYGLDNEPYFLAYFAEAPVYKFSLDTKASLCGNYLCEQSESCTSCPIDCQGVLTGKNADKWCCANSICAFGNCPVNCAARLRLSDPTNNVCEPDESCLTTNDCPSRKTTGNNENDFCCYGSNDGPFCYSDVAGIPTLDSPYCKTLNDPCGRGNSNGRGNGWGGW